MIDQPSRGDHLEADSVRNEIVMYWNQLSYEDDSGGTTWDVLDDLRMRVTDLLAEGSHDALKMASRLTALAEYRRRYGES